MIIFTADLKNQPGEMAHLCGALEQSGVNLELAGIAAGDHGYVLFTASDEDAARGALNGASVPFTEHPAVLVKLADRPGEAAKVARLLSEAHVNIEGVVATSICGGEVTIAVAVDKMADARLALGTLVVG